MKKLIILVVFTLSINAFSFELGIAPQGSFFLAPFYAAEETFLGYGIAVDGYGILTEDTITFKFGFELGFLRYYGVHVADDPSTPLVFFSDLYRTALYLEVAARAEIEHFYLCLTLGGLVNFISDTYTMGTVATDNSTVLPGFSGSIGAGYGFVLAPLVLDVGARFRLFSRTAGFDKLITLQVAFRFPL